MKKLVLAIVVYMSAISSSAFAFFFPPVVDSFDVERYLGRWYEVASTKPVFQENCLCTTADYSLNEAGNVRVANACRLGATYGPENSIVGEAVQSRFNPAKLIVSFGGIELPFSNYWVVDLADDYRYAVVSAAFRDPIFILSRTPVMSDEDYQGIIERLKANNFNLDKLLPTQQPGCTYPPLG